MLVEEWHEELKVVGFMNSLIRVPLYKNPTPTELKLIRFDNPSAKFGAGIIKGKDVYMWGKMEIMHDDIVRKKRSLDGGTKFRFKWKNKIKMVNLGPTGAYLSNRETLQTFKKLLNTPFIQKNLSEPKKFTDSYRNIISAFDFDENYIDEAEKLHAKKYKLKLAMAENTKLKPFTCHNLEEEWLTQFKMIPNKKIDVFKNPSKRDIQSIDNKWKDGAAIVTPNDWYVFSGEAFHLSAEKSIKKVEQFSKSSAFGIRFLINTNGTITAVGPGGASTDYDGSLSSLKKALVSVKKESKMIRSHKHISRLVSKDSTSYIDYDEAIIELTNKVENRAT